MFGSLKLAAILAIVAGILLLMTGITGAATWEMVQEAYEDADEPLGDFTTIFMVLIILGMLGGITVILGGVLIWKGMKRTGRLLITIGVGIGLIGLIIGVAIAAMVGEMETYTSPGLGMIGIILSVIARTMAK